jgi:hypothetical protein
MSKKNQKEGCSVEAQRSRWPVAVRDGLGRAAWVAASTCPAAIGTMFGVLNFALTAPLSSTCTYSCMFSLSHGVSNQFAVTPEVERPLTQLKFCTNESLGRDTKIFHKQGPFFHSIQRHAPPPYSYILTQLNEKKTPPAENFIPPISLDFPPSLPY